MIDPDARCVETLSVVKLLITDIILKARTNSIGECYYGEVVPSFGI